MTPDKGFVLITGAAKRIGRVIALYLAQAGWNIVVHYNTSRAEAEETARLIRQMGRMAHIAQADLSDAQAVEDIIPSLAAAKCFITALVNNASLFERDALDPDGSRHNATNYEAPCRLIEILAKNMPENTTGAVVNLLDATPIPPTFSAYANSKNKLAEATRLLALELAPRVRVNAVVLGPTMKNPRQSEQHFARMVENTPLGIATPPEAVAAAILFFLENTAITGETIHIDGGASLANPKI